VPTSQTRSSDLHESDDRQACSIVRPGLPSASLLFGRIAATKGCERFSPRVNPVLGPHGAPRVTQTDEGSSVSTGGFGVGTHKRLRASHHDKGDENRPANERREL